MSTLILFYSYTGHARAAAQTSAKAESADIAEIKEVKRPGKFKAYTAGCFAAIRGKPWPIQPLDKDPAAYDRIELFSPVWAGNPPPAVHAALAQLPQGKAVTVAMVSASGKSDCKEKMTALLKDKGCTLESYQDIKGVTKSAK